MSVDPTAPPRAGATSIPTQPGPGAQPSNRLRAGSIGLVAVLFMALANAAPITALTGNAPVAIGYGNGAGAPAGFLVATVILTVFSIGYVAMARHITATGSFYGFISYGLGQAWGLASGLLATFAYVVFEASLIGIFASFARSTITTLGGPEINWLWIALTGIVIIGLCGYFEISLSGKILGVFLVTEVVLLAVLAVRIAVAGGGPDGFVPSALNPAHAFSAATDARGVAVGSAGLGLFFAFWSWVGFETTAVYGEESKDPRRIVPRATLIAVVALGVFYTLVSWMVLAWNGTDRAVSVSRGTSSFDLFFTPVRQLLGGGTLDLFHVLTVLGSFACALAFHNAASRYVYAMAREGVSARLTRTLGRTHAKHRSPHVASMLQTVITLLITLGFYFFQKPASPGQDVPYVYQYGLMALIGTLAILIVQAVCSIAVIVYFHVGHNHPETASWWRTLLAPLVGLLGMGYVVVLLAQNKEFAAGAASGSPVFAVGPWLVLAIFVVGLAVGLVLRTRAPERYALIGRTVLEDAPADSVERGLPIV